MGEYLKEAGELSFRADVTYDSLGSEDVMIQYGGVAEVAVRRPDRLHVEFSGDERHSRIVLDGRPLASRHPGTPVTRPGRCRPISSRASPSSSGRTFSAMVSW